MASNGGKFSGEGGHSSPTFTGRRNAKNLYFSSACAYMGALSFGYMVGYSSPALPDMERESVLTPEEASWFGSLATFGAMFGGPLAGFLAEKVGRKYCLISTTLPFIIGWGSIFSGSDVSFLYFGRLLTGVGSGMCTVACPLYIAETSPTELRGMLGSGVQLGVTVGILLVYLLGIPLGWRALAAVGLLLPIVAVVFSLRIPETPRYFLLKGRKQDTLKTLAWLRGPGVDIEDECRDIEESLDPDDTMSWSEFKKPELLQPLKVAVGLMFFQQFSGINVVMFYTVSIFESAGYGKKGTLATVLIGIVQVVFTLVACIMMDKVGRRYLLLLAGMGMSITCFTMGYYYHASAEDPDNELSWLALASLIFYILFFAIGWGPIPMLVMSEIFPVRSRGRASAIATFAAWFSGFIITKEYNFLQETVGPAGAFWIFGAFCIVGMVFVSKNVPETKGKSLEDIELYFLGKATRHI